MNKGVRTIWLPLGPADSAPTPIRKNEGYINVQLASAQYKAKGTWWQKRLGGTDSVVLSTGITYRSGNDRIEAKAIQQRHSLKADTTRNLSINKVLAEKIPASADALSIELQLSVIQNDRLKDLFEMLHRPEFQPALELTPQIVGQVLTVSTLIKQLFTEESPLSFMHSTFAGIIPAEKNAYPLESGHLCEGWLIFLDITDPNHFSDGVDDKFEIKDLQLLQGGKNVDDTYVVFRITSEMRRGRDESSHWFKKYAKAIQHLDKLRLKKTGDEQMQLYKEALGLWIEGNVLLENDQNYIDRERSQIMREVMDELEKKYIAMGGSISGSVNNWIVERWA